MASKSRHFDGLMRRRQGFTLLEIIASIAIIAILLGITIVGARAVRMSQARTFANQQMKLIAQAINTYADDWPRWRYSGVDIADKGWPDYLPGRLFPSTATAPLFGAAAYSTIGGFNDNANSIQFVEDDGILVSPGDDDVVRVGDVMSANICLAYSLTAAVAKGPYLKPVTELVLQDIQDFDGTILNPGLPTQGTAGAGRAQLLIDPWGTPYRYFWVHREPNTGLAAKGFLPVFTADPLDPNFRRAVGYVLESAGPDKKFGNLWANPPFAAGSQEEKNAFDNLIIMP